MEGQFIAVLAVAIPIILFPAALVWYLGTSGLYQVIRESRRRRARLARPGEIAARTR